MTDAGSFGDLIPTVNSFLPWTIDVNIYMTPISNTNWTTQTNDTACVGAFTKDSSGTQNDQIAWDIVVPAGTWTFELMHKQDNNRGIYTVNFTQGSSQVVWGSIDGYNALGASRNVRSTIAGIAVTVASKGRLSLTMKTKNAGSASYVGSIQSVQLRRTA